MLRPLHAAAAAVCLFLPSLAFAAASVTPVEPAGFDCQARITGETPVPPPAAGNADAWQCSATTHHKLLTAEHWMRDSLEYCRIATSTYQNAADAARRAAATHPRGSWVVFLDADETVLDNSLYERERERCGQSFSDSSWKAWLRAGIAADVPGAAAFTQTVHRLGGYVAIVTNRDARIDPTTRANLTHLAIWFDYETGQPHGQPHDKTGRWKKALTVLSAKAHRSLVPVMWVGDQVTDFGIVGEHGQILRAMNEKDPGRGVGVRYFLIPNPIYGGWTKTPEN